MSALEIIGLIALAIIVLRAVAHYVGIGKPNYKACKPYPVVYVGQDQAGGHLFKGDMLSVEAEADGLLFVRNRRTGGTVSNVARFMVK